jgi:2-iminobutanoate/2-iminopropanoate deaminase
MFYSSGQIGINPETLLLKEGGILGQTKQTCENLEAVIKSANLEMKNIIKVNVFLADIRDFQAVNSVYKDYFSHKPARSCVAVAAIPAGALVEIEVIAEIS